MAYPKSSTYFTDLDVDVLDFDNLPKRLTDTLGRNKTKEEYLASIENMRKHESKMTDMTDEIRLNFEEFKSLDRETLIAVCYAVACHGDLVWTYSHDKLVAVASMNTIRKGAPGGLGRDDYAKEPEKPIKPAYWENGRLIIDGLD